MFLRNDVTVHLAGTRRGTPTFLLTSPRASVSRKVTMSSSASAGNTCDLRTWYITFDGHLAWFVELYLGFGVPTFIDEIQHHV